MKEYFNDTKEKIIINQFTKKGEEKKRKKIKKRLYPPKQLKKVILKIT